MPVDLTVDGRARTVQRDRVSLLEALRDELGVRSPKDGCSPQGQCGCCTVLVDGQPRVACVTAVRRVAGRSIVTADGLAPEVVEPLARAVLAAGGSQCGFCTPGILCRLAALGPRPEPAAVDRALLAHLCRCTGWQGIRDAARSWQPAEPGGSADGCGPRPSGDEGAGERPVVALSAPATRRATIEGRSPQAAGIDAVLGRGGFASDTAPADALVAVPDGAGGWAVGESLAEARAAAGVVAGRRSGRPLTWPLELPPGDWVATLRTTWVEPGYLEPDASWCVPGGEPASALANGGAFGGKLSSVAPAAARRLADESGRPVRVVLGREDVVRMGAKRPPVAIGVLSDGSGVARVARTPGIADAIRAAAPDLVIEEIDLAGPPTSAVLRAAGWAEAALVLAAARGDRQVTVRAPDGGEATATVDVADDGRPVRVRVTVACGDPLDAVVLRSYVVGAAHMALSWVCSEGIAVDEEGRPEDLTIRSWGILRAVDTPPVEVTIADGGGPPVNGSDAAFAAVAAAAWVAQGCPPTLPTMRDLRRS